MTWQATAKARWDYTLQLQMKKLGKHAKDVNVRLDYDNFDVFLKDLEGKHAQSQVGKLLSPKVVGQVQEFTAAITSMAQSESFASLTWGVLQAVLKVVEVSAIAT